MTPAHLERRVEALEASSIDRQPAILLLSNSTYPAEEERERYRRANPKKTVLFFDDEDLKL